MENRRGRANGAMNESDRKGRICISTRRDIDRERETNILHVALRGLNLGGRPRPKNQIDAMVEADGHVH